MTEMNEQNYDVAIIGGGILGTTLAYWLSSLYQGKIALLEKETQVAQHATLRNTGVIHRPFYLDPEKKQLFAISAQLSYGLWKQYAEQKDLPWNEVGTIEVAESPEEVGRVDKYLQYSLANGMKAEEVELLEGAELRRVEPNLFCKKALLCKTDTAVEFNKFAEALKDDAVANGLEFLGGFEVSALEQNSEGVTLTSRSGQKITARTMINCTGGSAVKIAHLMGVAPDYADLNFRGEYWLMKPEYRHWATHNIYSMPRYPEFPFLDPHWVVSWDGTVKIGPSAVPVIGAYTYEGLTPDIPSIFSKVFEAPFANKLKLLLNPIFLGMAAKEWQGVFSSAFLIRRLQKFLPVLRAEQLSEKWLSGVRSPVIDAEGNFVKEALEFETQHSYHILNFNSPGATGAPAFCAYLVKKLENCGKLEGITKKTSPRTIPGWDYQEIVSAFAL